MLIRPFDRILFIGDSVTDVDRARPVGSGHGFGLGFGYPLLVNARLAVDYPEIDLDVINVGISGNTTRDLLDRWKSDVTDLKPDIVSIMIGINDVWRQFDSPGRPSDHIDAKEYEENLKRLLELALADAREVLLLTPIFMEQHQDDPMRAMTDAYADICRKLAKEDSRIHLVDTLEAFDQLFKTRHYMTLAPDRVHPNTTGHTLIADHVIKALTKS